MEALSLTGQDAAPPLARGRYRLLEELGHGGMATVYRGHDDRLSRDVAVKVLNPGLSGNAILRARFVQEAKTMARLATNTRVVQIYDFGQDEDDQRLFIAMELLAGTVQQVLERHGPLPPRLAATILSSVLEVLEVAHELRIIHRDVKPSNILLTRDGTSKVGDFGIARIVGPRANGHLTRTGAGVGTWAYMAPEQKRDAGTVDHRADIYGVGATLFALLTNHEPHDIDRAETWQEQLEAIPAPLREIVLRATRYLPDERYLSAAEMNHALRASIDALPPDPPEAARLLIAPEAPPRPLSPPTLVPDPRPVAAPTGGLTTTAGSWPPPDLRPRPPLALMLVGVGASLVLGGWLLFGGEPAPVVEVAEAVEQAEDSGRSFVEPEGLKPTIVITRPGEPATVSSRPRTNATISAPPPPAPQLPAQVRLRASAVGECLVLLDGAPLSFRGSPYRASNLSFATVTVPSGAHTIGCKDGPTQSVTFAADRVLDLTLQTPGGGPS